MKLSSVIAGASAAIVAFQAVAYASRGESSLLRPPGAQGESDFMARCIKCGKCIEACPYQALKPAGNEAGMAVGTPRIDARDQACRLCEDFPCVDVCPTGALRDVSARSDVRMGVAVIDEEGCIAFQGMRCEVCYRACPLIDQAIVIDYRMREGDAIHTLFAPVIDEDACVGCGLCVERCVVSEPTVPIRIATDAERARGNPQ
ncbi:MAG: Ferredoxin-type protein NapG [Paraeggerthella hongkongensis]|uniref:4Fe-4S dicluster domain-containing protein n=1 Tax=unclassified Paraeggerthella TaxID=2641972 RepID=UPI000DF7AAD0|nr:4Fe-4S dicluster domain-containing protein [Paraeggerthella sp.]RDB57834.1 4Fe-4S ferredoxin [Paraeggerthella hongkongensis]